MSDFLVFLAQALRYSSETYNGISPIPWPLLLVALMPLYTMSLSSAIWWLRGNVWPVRCAYPITVKKHACLRTVAGEWRRCHDHRVRRTRRTDGHTIEPDLRRWQTVTKAGQITEHDKAGRGVVRLHGSTSSLLYRRGYARPQEDVRHFWPTWLRENRERWNTTKQRARAIWQAPRAWRTVLWSGTTPAIQGVADKLPIVIHATRMSIYTVSSGLLTVVIAVVLPNSVSSYVDYAAGASFMLTWGVLKEGVWLAEPTWLRRALKDTLRWLWPFVIFGVLLGPFVQNH